MGKNRKYQLKSQKSIILQLKMTDLKQNLANRKTVTWILSHICFTERRTKISGYCLARRKSSKTFQNRPIEKSLRNTD